MNNLDIYNLAIQIPVPDIQLDGCELLAAILRYHSQGIQLDVATTNKLIELEATSRRYFEEIAAHQPHKVDEAHYRARDDYRADPHPENAAALARFGDRRALKEEYALKIKELRHGFSAWGRQEVIPVCKPILASALLIVQELVQEFEENEQREIEIFCIDKQPGLLDTLYPYDLEHPSPRLVELGDLLRLVEIRLKNENRSSKDGEYFRREQLNLKKLYAAEKERNRKNFKKGGLITALRYQEWSLEHLIKDLPIQFADGMGRSPSSLLKGIVRFVDQPHPELLAAARGIVKEGPSAARSETPSTHP